MSILGESGYFGLVACVMPFFFSGQGFHFVLEFELLNAFESPCIQNFCRFIEYAQYEFVILAKLDKLAVFDVMLLLGF